MWAIITALSAACFGIVASYQIQEVVELERSVRLFYQDWVGREYERVDWTQSQEKYYKSLLPRSDVSLDSLLRHLETTSNSPGLSGELDMFLIMHNDWKDDRKLNRMMDVLEPVHEYLYTMLKQSTGNKPFSYRHRRQATEGGEKTKAQLRAEESALRKAIREQGRQAWRQYLKQKKANRKERGKFPGPKNKEGKRKKWQRKMEQKKGGGLTSPPTANVNPPPLEDEVAAPPLVDEEIGAPPIPPRPDFPDENIPRPDPDTENEDIESGPSDFIAPPIPPRPEFPKENIPIPDADRETEDLESGRTPQDIGAPPIPPRPDVPDEFIPIPDPKRENENIEAGPPEPVRPPPIPERESVPQEFIPIPDPRKKRDLDQARDYSSERPSYTSLTSEEQNQLKTALLWMINTQVDGMTKYDVFVTSHRLMEAPLAYNAAEGYQWHRDFLESFEAALRQYDARVTLPYFNLCSVFTESASNGLLDVLSGITSEQTIVKECQWIGTKVQRIVNRSNITLSNLARLLNCHGATDGNDDVEHFTTEDYAMVHSVFGKCEEGGAHLACPSCAVIDPLFWLIYADIDRIIQKKNLLKSDF